MVLLWVRDATIAHHIVDGCYYGQYFMWTHHIVDGVTMGAGCGIVANTSHGVDPSHR